jgi:single-strand DNA-binding protein
MANASQSQVSTSYSEVTIVGRLGSRVEQRVLPSGDTVTTFTVVVDRPARDRVTGSGTHVDAIACQTFRAPVARRLESLGAGDWVRAEGPLRRRFWRAGAALGSAMEVDVRRLERVRVQP